MILQPDDAERFVAACVEMKQTSHWCCWCRCGVCEPWTFRNDHVTVYRLPVRCGAGLRSVNVEPPASCSPPVRQQVELFPSLTLTDCRGRNFWGFAWTHPDVCVSVDLIWDLLLSHWSCCRNIMDLLWNSTSRLIHSFKVILWRKTNLFPTHTKSLALSYNTLLLLHSSFFTFYIIYCVLASFLFHLTVSVPLNVFKCHCSPVSDSLCKSLISPCSSAHEHQGAPTLHHQFLTSACLHTSKPDSHMLLHFIPQV